MDDMVLDFLQVKTIEKSIGRKLDEFEIESFRLGQPIFVQNSQGFWFSHLVKSYIYPYGLMSLGSDLIIEKKIG
jgi:hypothetical protein